MALRASTLFVCLLLASAAGAETVYKYRAADGQITYSSSRVPGATLLDTFETRFPPPAPPAVANARRATPADDARINKRLAALDAAWLEVQEATQALNTAQARLAAGVAPLEEESTSLGYPPPAPALKPGESPPPGILLPAPPATGGPQPTAAPAAGGPQAAASPAVGGPMGARRGGGRNAEYHTRMAMLEEDVLKARARVDAAYRRYNELR